MTSSCSAGVMTSATVSSSRRMPRSIAARIGRSERMSVAVSTPSTFSWSSVTRSRRTPRVIMNWLAPASGACGRIVAGATRVRSVITCAAGDSAVTRGDCGCSGRRKPASAPSSRIGSGWYSRSMSAIPSVLGLNRFEAPRARPAIGLQVAMQLDQRLAIDVALEVDHGLERDPVVVPAPGIELGMAARAELDVAVAPDHAQQEPDLLLAAVGALAEWGAGLLVRLPGAA